MLEREGRGDELKTLKGEKKCEDRKENLRRRERMEVKGDDRGVAKDAPGTM